MFEIRKPIYFMVLCLAAPMLALTAAAEDSDDDAAWLGVVLQDLTPSIRSAMDLESGLEGVLVSRVMSDSPAEKAGIQDGDILVRLDGKNLDSVDGAIDLVRGMKPGSRARLEYLRDGKSRDVRVTLGEREDADELVMPRWQRVPEPPRAPRAPRAPRPGVPSGDDDHWVWMDEDGVHSGDGPGHFLYFDDDDRDERGYLGVSTMELGDQLAAYFEVDTERGVLVTDVREGSPAEKAGLRAGDVILAVNRSSVESSRELRRLVRAHDPEDQIEIEIKRKGATMMLQATLGNAAELGDLAPELEHLRMRELHRLAPELEALQKQTRHMERQAREMQRRAREHERDARRMVIVRRGMGAEI